jgi:hypothetical protein
MIIAHNQFELLEKLILALDDERNDIFIHIDAKVKGFDFEYFKSLPRFSRIVFTDNRVNITWGDYSQVKTEIELLKTAVNNENADKPYEYYHLISGVDLPIKSNDYIHTFFNDNKGKEFIHFTNNSVSDFDISRLKYYHLFRRRRNTFNKILAQIVLRAQILFRVDRLKGKDINVQKGCNWFSITGEFAHYIVENLNNYKDVFTYSYCGDETFVQTMLVNSPYKDNLYMPQCNNNHVACMRLIDWERGNPYIWRSEDFEIIRDSECIFARKFDINIDSDIIDRIMNELLN